MRHAIRLPRAALPATLLLGALLFANGATRAAPPEGTLGERRAHLYRPELPNARPASPPRRIVSLAPVLTESLFALELGDRVVGVTRYCDRPAAATRLPQVGGYVDPQLEAILTLRPDLVVAMPSFGQRQVLDRLRERGVPVLVAFADSIGEIRDLLRGLGEVTGSQRRARYLVTRLNQQLRAITSSVAEITERPRAVVVFQVEPLVVAGPGTFAEEALELAGAVPAAPRGAPAWPTWSLETLLAVAPDVLVTAEGPDAAKRLRARLVGLGAAGSKIVVSAPAHPILMRPGPSLYEDVAVLARLLAAASTTSSQGAP